MSGAIDVLNPDKPKRVLVLASNPAVSGQTGWPIGFWWAELTHPYWEFTERGYSIDVASPEGGRLQADSWSDPRDKSKYSADDLISLGFVNSPEHMTLVEESKSLSDVRVADYDALLVIGGQGPMYTFYENQAVHDAIRDFYEARQADSRHLPRHVCPSQDATLRRQPARPGKDLDRLRQLRGGLRRRVRRAADPAVSDRGRGTGDREHELHRLRALQAARGQGWDPDHGAAAVLGSRRRAPCDRGARPMTRP